MADRKQLYLLKKGVNAWNEWREEHPDVRPNLWNADLNELNLSQVNLGMARLDGANLSGTNLTEANLSKANLVSADLSRTTLICADLFKATLYKANLSEADFGPIPLFGRYEQGTNLTEANLSEANLTRSRLNGANLNGATLVGANLNGANLNGATLVGANLNGATLVSADLSSANLRGATINWADLSRADLSRADLSKANLSQSILNEAILDRACLKNANLNGATLYKAYLHEVDLSEVTLISTNLKKANLTNCWIYGISAWDVQLEDTIQLDLVITSDQPIITVDNLKVAQFLYLLLKNQEIRDVINTINYKLVLILGRFTSERKVILDALKKELRKKNYLPVVFDFEKPANRDITETISSLAHLSRFILADITDAKSIPQELQAIVPHLPSVPIQPLLLVSDREYGMFEHFMSYPWVLPVYHYLNVHELLNSIQEQIIDPAEKKLRELAIEKAKRLERL